MWSAANSCEIDRAIETRFDQWPDDEIRIGDAELRKEPQAKPGFDHSLHPIVTRRAEHLSEKHAAAVELLAHRLEDFAVGPADVWLLVEFGSRDFVERY